MSKWIVNGFSATLDDQSAKFCYDFENNIISLIYPAISSEPITIDTTDFDITESWHLTVVVEAHISSMVDEQRKYLTDLESKIRCCY